MKVIKKVSVLFMTLTIGLSLLLSGCSFGSVKESIDTTPTKSIIQGEGRYEYFVMVKGKSGRFHMYPIKIPYPQVGPKPQEGGKK